MFVLTLLITLSTLLLWVIVKTFGKYNNSDNHDNQYYQTLSNIKGVTYCKTPYKHIKISSSKICHELYTKPMTIPKGLNLGDLFSRWLGSCMGTLNTRDPEWSKLKKIFLPIFNAKNDDLCKKLMLEWELNIQSLYQTSKQNYSILHLNDIINDLPLKYITYLIFGETYYKTNKKSFNLLQKYANILMGDIFNENFKCGVRKYSKTEIDNVLNNFKLLWDEILKNALNDDVQTEGVYIAIHNNYLNNNMITYEMFSQTLIEIIYANQDVVTPAFAWLLVNYSKYYNLLDNPEHFIEESGRISPIFPTSMPKITFSDVVIDGYTIKKNTVVCIDFIGINNNVDE